MRQWGGQAAAQGPVVPTDRSLAAAPARSAALPADLPLPRVHP